MAIYVSGSLAFDRIMSFRGNFKDSVLMDRLDKLNISFMVEDMIERRGGCAGNIAYTLALLGAHVVLVSSAGRDFGGYREHLAQAGVDLAGLREDSELFTALCYITTDLTGNQLTGFYPGAMSKPSGYDFANLAAGDVAIVSPGNMDDMLNLPGFYREKGTRFIFDPGQQLPLFTRETLTACVTGSFAYVCNDYELSMTCRTLGREEGDLLKLTEWLVTTLGEKGARVRGRDGSDVTIPAVPCGAVLDPTGAGDSQRAGLLLGIERGLPMPVAARLGAVTASYAIERRGTQEHHFTAQEFAARYEAAFGPMPLTL